MIEIILCVGVPASSKSTWAKSFIKSNSNYIRINNDDIRSMAFNSIYSKSNEALVNSMRTSFIKEALNKKKSVILDNVNAHPKHFEEACDIVKKLNIDCTVKEKNFYVDLDVAIERDSKRIGTAKVGDVVIKKFFASLGGKSFKDKAEKEYINYYNKDLVPKEHYLKEQDQALPKAVICDLDTTLALLNKRSPFEPHRCMTDDLNIYVYNNLLLHIKDNCKIFFITGRKEEFRKVSKQWLDKYISFDYELYMKPDGSDIKDFIFKEQIYKEKIENKYKVMAVYDDRRRVVEKFHSIGLPVFSVGNPTLDY